MTNKNKAEMNIASVTPSHSVNAWLALRGFEMDTSKRVR